MTCPSPSFPVQIDWTMQRIRWSIKKLTSTKIPEKITKSQKIQNITFTKIPNLSHSQTFQKYHIHPWNEWMWWGSNLESLQTEIIQNRSDGNSKIRWNNTTIIFIFSRPKLACFVLWNLVTWQKEVQVILFDTNLLPTSSPTHKL